MADNAFPRVEEASDHSLLVSFDGNEDVRRLFLSLRKAPLPGVFNLHPAYVSLLVDFDPMRAEAALLADEIRRLLDTAADPNVEPSREIVIPVCYGGELGRDLEAVAAHCGLAPAEVIERHAAPEYRVAFLGFAPGFPYLSGMDPKLATPRLTTPRTRTPAGSVAIGGAQTGVYPAASPGGWRVIGRTPITLFDVRSPEPALLAMGDCVRFRPISIEEFHAWPG